jgi:hypothetical protein
VKLRADSIFCVPRVGILHRFRPTTANGQSSAGGLIGKYAG